MLKIISFILFFPLWIFSQDDLSENILFIDYTYSLHIKGLPTAYIINSKLTANPYSSLYEMDNMGNMNLDEEDSENGAVFTIKSKSNDFIFKDFKENYIYSIERVEMKPFFVKDSMNIFDWKLVNDFKTIIGYNCQKATTYYRGRNYIAYFTTEIPFHTGPWKFCGLPGLILEAYSIDNVFKISANKMQIKNSDFIIKNPFSKKSKKFISWDEFIYEYNKKYNEFLHYRYPSGGSISIPKKGIETYIY